MGGRPALFRALPPMLALLPALGGCGGQGAAVPAASARPLRVMSMNQCTDQIVLALLPPSRITSVTWMSRDPRGSLMARAARRVGVNHGQAEEVLAQRPDLVVAGSGFSTPVLRGMIRRLGYPMIEVDHAYSIADVRRITRQIAAAVGERARGEALIARMDRAFADLARDPGPPVRVVAWDQNGISAAPGGLYDAVLTAAGARNVGAVAGGRPDMERLLAIAPRLLVRGVQDTRGGGLGDDVTRHRLVRRYWGGGRTLTVRQAYYTCGTPMVAQAALSLRAQLRRAAALAPGLPYPPRGPDAPGAAIVPSAPS